MLVTPLSGSQADMGLERKTGDLSQTAMVTRLDIKPLLTSLANTMANVAKKIEVFEVGINYRLVSQFI